MAMEEIGLFPLRLVLLPGERAPLHIFEPRYRELIGECLDEDREFGLVLEDDDGMREVGTAAAVVEVLDRFQDGRLNIVVEGRERFRSSAETEGRSFRTAEVEPRRRLGGRRPTRRSSAASPPTRGVVRRPRPSSTFDREAGLIAYQIAARVDFGTEVKQELLELRSERERVVRPRRCSTARPRRSRPRPRDPRARDPATASRVEPLCCPRWAGIRARPVGLTVDGAPGRLPDVVRGARAERRPVLDHARVPADLLRALRMAQEVRVVALLPDEDQMSGGHELGHVGAARGRQERVGGHAEPAGVVSRSRRSTAPPPSRSTSSLHVPAPRSGSCLAARIERL